MNAVAGGGSFLSLPALLSASSAAGVGAVTAQATNTVALWPGQLSALTAFRRELRSYGWSMAPIAVASGVGGWMGGRLLLMTSNHWFRALLPWLLLFGTIMFILSYPLGKWLAGRSNGRRYNAALVIGMVIVSVYVGYFATGGGFLVMALFGICGVHDIHEMTALKVLTAAVSIGIPAFTFIFAGRIEWRFCLDMAVLAGLGGFLAAHVSHRISQRMMRWAIALIGLGTTAYFFWQNAMRHG